MLISQFARTCLNTRDSSYFFLSFFGLLRNPLIVLNEQCPRRLGVNVRSLFLSFLPSLAQMAAGGCCVAVCCRAVIISDSWRINEVCEMVAHFLVLSTLGGHFFGNKMNYLETFLH